MTGIPLVPLGSSHLAVTQYQSGDVPDVPIGVCQMVDATLSSMLKELRARCPVLCPSVVPNGLHDGSQGVALLALARDADDRRRLAAVLNQARGAAGGRCAITKREVADASELRCVAQWELQPDQAHTYRLSRCMFVSTDVALLLDTAAMLERFALPGADVKELSRLARTFCEANQQSGEERDSLDARLWLQECLTLAHACQVVASNMKAWNVVGPDGQALADVGSAVALAQRLLGGTTDSSRPRAVGLDGGRNPSSAKKGQTQQRKRKVDAEATAPARPLRVTRV